MIGEKVKTDNYYRIFEEESKEWILKYVDSKLRESNKKLTPMIDHL
jgi:hypothetical protein